VKSQPTTGKKYICKQVFPDVKRIAEVGTTDALHLEYNTSYFSVLATFLQKHVYLLYNYMFS